MLVFTGIVAGTAVLSFYIGYVARAESTNPAPLGLLHSSNGLYTSSGGPSGTSSGEDSATIATDQNGLKNKDVLAPSAAFVASKNGSKYYPADCAGAGRIKEGNRVYFSTEAKAEAAGYTPAAGC